MVHPLLAVTFVYLAIICNLLGYVDPKRPYACMHACPDTDVVIVLYNNTHVYHTGQAYFNSCPAAPQVEAPVDPASACSGVIPLTRETGDDVNFDTRVEYRNGGSCGVEQSIRLMILRQLGSETVTHYICSNLGSNSRNPCSNRTRVSVMYHGGNKYDITLRLHNVKESDSGMYEVSVDLNDAYGGRRTTIIKTFELSVQGTSTQVIVVNPCLNS